MEKLQRKIFSRVCCEHVHWLRMLILWKEFPRVIGKCSGIQELKRFHCRSQVQFKNKYCGCGTSAFYTWYHPFCLGFAGPLFLPFTLPSFHIFVTSSLSYFPLWQIPRVVSIFLTEPRLIQPSPPSGVCDGVGHLFEFEYRDGLTADGQWNTSSHHIGGTQSLPRAAWEEHHWKLGLE